jgi:glycosyltransferase involved in cell wall biosynthesis
VDDGSVDKTPDLLAEMEAEGAFVMRVIRTENGGKPRAVNLGVREARGELFFIVDSDDYLTPDAIAQIEKQWAAVKDNSSIAGLCFRRVFYTTGKLIAGPSPVAIGDYSSIEIAYALGMTGDKSEVFRTSVLRDFPFPEIEGEKFVPEALVWNRIACTKKLRFVDRGIYMCEYLPDGLVRNFATNLRRNPRGFELYYRELLGHRGVSAVAKAKALVRLAQCGAYKKKP